MLDQDRIRGKHGDSTAKTAEADRADGVDSGLCRHSLNMTTNETKTEGAAQDASAVVVSSPLQALAMAASMASSSPQSQSRRGKKSKVYASAKSREYRKNWKNRVQGSYCPQIPEDGSSEEVDSLFWHADTLASHEQSHSQDQRADYANFVAENAENGSTQPMARYHKQISTILAQGMFRQWMQRRTFRLLQDSPNMSETSESVFYKTAMLLLQNMIFAMRADGKNDQAEQQAIFDLGLVLFHDDLSRVRGEFDRMLTIDLDPELLARQVEFSEESLDLYLLAAVMLDSQHFLEQSYLESLAACLKIDPTLRQYLNERAHVLVSNEELAANASLKASLVSQGQREAI